MLSYVILSKDDFNINEVISDCEFVLYEEGNSLKDCVMLSTLIS